MVACQEILTNFEPFGQETLIKTLLPSKQPRITVVESMSKSAALLLVLVFLGASGIQASYAQFDGLPYEPPIVTVLASSPNGTVNMPDVPLNVTVQIRGFIYHNIETIRWLNYSLDGQTAIPMELIVPSDLSPGYYVYGNDVLTGLSDGTHNLTIYGETAVSGLTGNFNATVSFTVDTSATPTEPFPTLLVTTASGVLVAVIGVFLLIYFKKRRH
jgi:hypothetical protein